MILIYLAISIISTCYYPSENLYSAKENSSHAFFLKNDTVNYNIKKLDSLDNFYIIYATKDDWTYKIVSEKDSNSCIELISVGKSYSFNLQNAKERISAYALNVDCIIYNDTTKICIEKNDRMIAALFEASNLKGLCFINSKTEIR